ncbi:hypothetical protein HD554DRAFT_2176873 [Boletus coccyginus]|nr:hypothetical protein HD554DRAFT_2176873 [Boletus coccyginus]
MDLAGAMSALYTDESKRAEKIQDVLEAYNVHFSITKIKITGYETDGDISTQNYHYVVVEFKNEAGNTSGEPYFQTIGYYLESTRLDAPKMPNSPLPCLLLSIFGPYIVFAVPTLTISSSWHDTWLQFRKAIQTLKQYYDTLQPPQSLSSMSSPQLFPYHTAYTSRITKTMAKEIVYQRQLSEDKLIFFGFEDTHEGDRICIKFVRRYSVEAHEHCVLLGCAPTLRGFEKIPGGWFMVVMDDISDGHETLFSKPVSITTKELIAEKLAKFHEAGFVHGDIRDTNVMVSKLDEKDFNIVDFDWAGRASEVTYPACVNREIWRPTDAIDGQPILAVHDIAMLHRIGR